MTFTKQTNKKIITVCSYELIAAAAAYEAVNVWEKKQKEEGKEVQHATAKKLIAGIAAKEVSK